MMIEIEDMRDVPLTDEIRGHWLFLHFIKWLGDNRIPLGPKNFPRLFAKFLEEKHLHAT